MFWPLVQRPPYFSGVSSLEPDVPKSVGHSEPTANTLRAVVIKVMSSGIPEVGIAEFVEVHAMMNPLRHNIALDIAGEHDGQSVYGKEKAQRRCKDKQRKQISDIPIDVFSVERVRMVAVVYGIENLVQIVLYAGPILELVVKEPAM
jgi:hypothetical protein